MAVKTKVVERFKRMFGGNPQHLVRAPGRVNLIGEHTDYNDGFVLPMAVDLGIWIALQPRADQRLKVHSLNFDQTTEFSLLDFDPTGDWSAYVRGIVWALTEEGFAPSGWEGVLGGNIPTGAGLSSSAALELALLRAFRSVSGWEWDGVTMARAARKAENSYVGVQSGIMDQMASALGEEGKALLIDTRDLTWRSVPLVPGVRVVILDTGTRRGLVDSAYNQRVSECQAAAEILEVNSLRDVDRKKLEASKGEMESTIYRRAFHVVTENERTLQAAEAMENGDPVLLGRLVDASHESLRVNYQVSSPELDLMVKIARGQPGTYGARMTGAGFGGAAVAFVSAENLESFITEVHKVYARETETSPTLIPTLASQGAEQLY